MSFSISAQKRRRLQTVGKRENQIDRLMQTTVGMYGDLQGIAGNTLQEIEGLEMKALDASSLSNKRSAG